MTRRLILVGGVAFVVGVLVGGYLFSASQPRSFLALRECGASCYQPNDVAGLLASVGLQRAAALIPGVTKETDRCLAIRHPFARAHYHMVIFPKKDTEDIADVTDADQPVLMDCLRVIRALIVENGLRRYRVYTNGPARQDATYLHLHLETR
jgi:hypothetical protein